MRVKSGSCYSIMARTSLKVLISTLDVSATAVDILMQLSERVSSLYFLKILKFFGVRKGFETSFRSWGGLGPVSEENDEELKASKSTSLLHREAWVIKCNMWAPGYKNSWFHLLWCFVTYLHPIKQGLVDAATSGDICSDLSLLTYFSSCSFLL